MKNNRVSVAALIAAAVAAGIEVVDAPRTSKVAQQEKVEYKANSKPAARKAKGSAGKRQNERLGYVEGQDCCFCDKGTFKAVVKAQVGEATRNRATFKGCKHTVNVY